MTRGGAGSGKGRRWLNVNICTVKSGKICKGSAMTGLGTRSSLQGQTLLVCLLGRPLGTMITRGVAAPGSPYPSPPFLAVSPSLLCWSLGGRKLKRDLHVVPRNAREAGHSPCSSSPGHRESLLFPAGALPLGAEQHQRGDRRIPAKVKLSSSISAVVPQCFCPTASLKVLCRL